MQEGSEGGETVSLESAVDLEKSRLFNRTLHLHDPHR
jgi:hypothetical protein